MSDYSHTTVSGVDVAVQIDWTDLGTTISDASSDEQAAFIQAWADAMSVWNITSAEMQLQYIADRIMDLDLEFDRDRIRWLLSGILDRITEEVGA